MARRWKKMAVLGRKRILSATQNAVASRGHVFVYSADGRRFTIPLRYLSGSIFHELLRISEEEFGLPADGPITVPCDAAFMERVLFALRRPTSMDVETAVLLSISNCRLVKSSSSFEDLQKKQVLVRV
ncbi:hypothetical protein KSP39_PZI004395 [Platanthera zijinensis]|uniref:Small auxin up regulated protein n=1 Tax=Platanthera zijinensis TaxID=2320716 RepID=A0AAP0BYC9_9ASPA